MPVSQSILWIPGGGLATATAVAYPIFVRQRVLGAIHDHVASDPNKGLLGFLVGDLCECPPPESGVRYVFIDSVIRFPQLVYGDKMLHVVSQVWPVLQDQLQQSGGQLLGWYHSHPPIGVTLAPGDIETHRRYFGQPWQVALVLGTDEQGPAGGFFRPGPSGPQSPTRLPFYEFFDPGTVTPEGRYRSRVPWKDYRPHQPAPAADAAPPPAAAAKPRATQPPPPVVPPAPVVKRAPPAPRPVRRRSGRRIALFAALGVVGLGGGAAVLLLRSRAPESAESAARAAPPVAPESAAVTPESAAVAPEPARATPESAAAAPESARAASAPVRAGPEPARPIAEPARAAVESLRAAPGPARVAAGPAPVKTKLDQLGDSLAAAIRGYMSYTTLLDTRRLDCPGLQSRLVAVEERGMAYYAEQRAQANALDSARAARHRSFYSGIDSVQSHFNRSGCARP